MNLEDLEPHDGSGSNVGPFLAAAAPGNPVESRPG